MAQNVVAKLTSPKWLREAVLGRGKNILNAFGFEPSVIQRQVAGETCQFYIGNVTGKSWYGSPVDASLEMTFVKDRIVRPGMVVFECGAHHGAQTILLSRWVGASGKVVAIEPGSENTAILKKNVELNALDNVAVVNKAAAAHNGSVAMRLASNSAVSVRQSGWNIGRFETVTLDQVALDHNLAPDFLKIDVEGFEFDVLEGSSSILSKVPAVFIEIHTLSLPRYGRKFEDLWRYMNPALYDIFIQSEDDEPPVPYAAGLVPTGRVHFFFLPKPASGRSAAV